MKRPVVLVITVAMATQALAQSSSYQALLVLNDELADWAEPVTKDGVIDERSETIGAKHEALRTLSERLSAIDPSSWSRSEKIDYLLVRARIREAEFEHRVMRPWSRDPVRSVNRIGRIPYRDVPVPEADVADFRARLNSVGPTLAQARHNLTEVSTDLANQAIRHLERHDGVGQGEPVREPPVAGIIGWYRDLHERLSEKEPELAAEALAALLACESFRDWLRGSLPRLTHSAAIGLDNYDWYLKHVRLMPYTSEDVRRLGERELQRALTFLAIEENRNRNLPELTPATSKEQYDAMTAEAEAQIRAIIADQNLLTIPSDTPPAFETDAFFIRRPGGKRHFWEEIQYRNALNNHIHASIPGHRFDGFLQRPVTNPIRARHRDGSRAEGWTFYIEEMLLQAGILDEIPRARELFYIAQLARAVRIPSELSLQTGRMSLDDAVAYMVGMVPLMEEDLARYDLEIYLRRPAYGMNYTMGMIQLEALVAEQAHALGDDFDLGAFHDRFLSAGSIPISLIAWEMAEDDAAYEWLWEE